MMIKQRGFWQIPAADSCPMGLLIDGAIICTFTAYGR